MIAQTSGISTPTEEYIPWKIKVQPSELYKEMIPWATGQWEFTRKQLIKRSPQVPADDVLRSTRFAAEALLPDAKVSGQKSAEQILREEQERLMRQLA